MYYFLFNLPYNYDSLCCGFFSCFSKMAKLEELEEVDISGNKLKAIPTTITNCRRMHTVIAHSNCIEVFPEVMQLPEIKVCGFSPSVVVFKERILAFIHSFGHLHHWLPQHGDSVVFAPSFLTTELNCWVSRRKKQPETKPLDWDWEIVFHPLPAAWHEASHIATERFPSA